MLVYNLLIMARGMNVRQFSLSDTYKGYYNPVIVRDKVSIDVVNENIKSQKVFL